MAEIPLEPFLVPDGPIRYLAAERTTVLFKAGPDEDFRKLCTIVFHKKNGSIFAQFTYFRSGPGIASAVDVTVGADGASQVSFAESGKVSTHLLKYSHPPDGRAHLSQDGKGRTLFWSKSIELSKEEGHLFEIHAHHLEPFDALEAKLEKNRLYLPFRAASSCNAVTVAVEWRLKSGLKSLASSQNRTFDVIAHLPGRQAGTEFRAALLGQPTGFPLQDHLLLVNVHPIEIPASITSPSLILMGGWHPGFRNPRPGTKTQFLAFQYPVANPAELRERVGSVDLDVTKKETPITAAQVLRTQPMTPNTIGSLDGFDPLERYGDEAGAEIAQVFEDANRRIVHNILKSYTGYFDLFSEMLQNALDAVQQRQKAGSASFKPRVWVSLDIGRGVVRVTDNGIGMNEQEFKLCLRPNVSFKKQADLRGHKGVGATFLAYGYSFIRLQSKQKGNELSAVLRQGRHWAEDESGTIPRPKFEGAPFGIPELANEDSGTSVEIIVGQAAGERPKNLAWIGAQTAEQWLNVLRIKTPLGGVYLRTPSFAPLVEITVKANDGTTTTATTARPEYYYPHEIPNLKAQSLRDINKALAAIPGDANTKFTKVSSDYKRLDCVWEIWGKEELLQEDSYFVSALDEDMKLLIERHAVTVYACFLRSAKLWGEFNDEVLKLRAGQRIIHGGLQIASDFMAQGDLQIIPLTSTIGYQANSHVVVHFVDGNPDMGRKVFQPELKGLAEALAVRSVNTMKRFLQHMRPDTGASSITPDRELYDWKKSQEAHRDRHPLSYERGGKGLALVSAPQQEQDVVALFHELVGIGLLKGLRFFATSQSDRYDSLFMMELAEDAEAHFDRTKERLGISRSYALPMTTEPKVLEYKYSFESLVDDFEREEKFAKQIDLVVCWTTGTRYKERFFLRSLLIGDEGSDRALYGSTHQAFAVGSPTQPAFEVIIIEELLSWLQNPSDEEAHQKRKYKED